MAYNFDDEVRKFEKRVLIFSVVIVVIILATMIK